MADVMMKNADSGDFTEISCVYSRVGPGGIHVKLNMCLGFVCVYKFR